MFEDQAVSGELMNGVLRCDCYEYPVVSGIAVLRQMSPVFSTRNVAVDHIRNHDPNGALLWLLLNGSADGVPPLDKMHTRAGIHFKKQISDLFLRQSLQKFVNSIPSGGGFETALYAGRPRGYADYLFHRFANPSLLGAIPPLAILSDECCHKKHGRVLDLLCGVGHTSAIMNSICPELEVMECDSDFVNLYLLHNFIAPHTPALCMDAELNLPLADSSVDGLFCLDGIHYIRSKVNLLHEVERVINKDGIWLFAHMHNLESSNKNPGVPLSAEDYAKRFAFGQQRLLSEVEIIKQFRENGYLDLRKQPDIWDIASSPALTLIGTRNGSLWKRHLGIEEILCRFPEMLYFNPLYRIEKAADGLDLIAEWPSDTLRQECNQYFPVLPERFAIPSRVVEELNALNVDGVTSSNIRDLLRSFILVNLPSCYSRQKFLN